MTQYFIQTTEGQQGPFSLHDLSTKNINVNTPIWYDGLVDWTTAGKIEALKPLLDGTNTPPPFQKAVVPPYQSPVAFEPEKKTFKFNLIQTVGLIVAVFTITFVYLRGGSTSSSSSTSLADSASIAEISNIESEEERINRELTEKNTNYRNNWIKYIEATTGAYKSRVIGGIFDLETVINNKTEYVLDEVKVRVHYIKDNGGAYKTEEVTIYNVPAHGKAAMPAPDSDRGTSVEMEISSITSKKMHFCYTIEKAMAGGPDPFFCRY